MMSAFVPIPDYQTRMRPLLAVKEDGQERPVAQARDQLAASVWAGGRARRDAAERQAPHVNIGVGWAATYLYRSGLLERPRRSGLGVINEDRLGSSGSTCRRSAGRTLWAVQTCRSSSALSLDAVQPRASSSPRRTSARRDPHRHGQQLAQLMIEHDVAVFIGTRYDVKRLDLDHFADEASSALHVSNTQER